MLNLRSLFSLAAFAVVSFAAVVGRAEPKYAPVPPGQGGKGALELRVVSYSGSTNGELTVEVRNRGQASETFDARGLYFVPDGSADQAPQRVGAVGPVQVLGQSGWERKETLVVPPGASVTARLDVFCIDSHRASPGNGTGFKMATSRMPKDLTRSIQADGHKAAQRAGGYAAPAAKSAVQSEVWRNRDKDWVKLEGEGKQEDKKSHE
jgi:hypothetical protein